MFRAPALPRTLEAAVRDLASPRVEIRSEAARDLARHGGDADKRAAVVTALSKALSDPSSAVRNAAALGLADVEANEAIPALVEAATGAGVAEMALAALGELGATEGEPAVRAALAHARPEVRFQAVIAYPRVAERRSAALDVLAKATYDADPLVCHVAVRIAEEVGRDGREGVVDDKLVTRLRALLRHDAVLVRVAAAVALARAGEDGGHAIVASAAAGDLRTPDGEDEAAAIEIAGDLSLEAARAGLERRAWSGLLRKDRFAWHARVALARMGHERAVREILGELASWDRDKRTLAAAAAGRARLAAARPTLEAFRADPSRADPGAVAEAIALLEGA